MRKLALSSFTLNAFVLVGTTRSFADAARVAGDLKVNGIHFSTDGSVLTSAPKDGKSVLNGSGPPTVVGNIGDFYIDTINNRLYGPYEGAWGGGVSLVGPQGIQGQQGQAGPANTLSIGTVTTGASGSQAEASITGTAPNQVLNLTIPQGSQGATPQITLATICAVVSAENAPSPSYCKAITGFSITAPSAQGTISQVNQTIAVTVPSGTNVTALAPAISHTGVSINPASGAVQDFTNPVVYTVTASDTSTQNYFVTITVAPWAVCGDVLTYAGENYSTVQLGAQCWFAKNVNVGAMVPVASGQGVSCASIQKYCYGDTSSNCTAYGGLYTWTQAMCGSQSEKAQGICPVGWHIPTDPEYVALTNYLGSTTCGTYRWGNNNYCGAPAGDRMKAAGLCQGRSPCGDSGFNGLMAGHSGGTDFVQLGAASIFWTSSKNNNNIEAWRSGLAIDQGGVDSTFFYSPFNAGRSIRCVKD